MTFGKLLQSLRQLLLGRPCLQTSTQHTIEELLWPAILMRYRLHRGREMTSPGDGPSSIMFYTCRDASLDSHLSS